jgi:hypothetical protein
MIANWKMGVAAAALTAAFSVGANAATIGGTLTEGGVTPFKVGDIETVEIEANRTDGAGLLSFGLLAGSDLAAIETNSLNPVTGFVDALVTISTGEDGTGSILGSITGAALAAGEALIVSMDAGTTYWLNASWSDVAQNLSNFDLRIEAAPVPVPAAGFLLLGGLGGLAAMKRRKKS